VLVKGPFTTSLKKDINAFKRKHKKIVKKQNRYFAREKRKYKTAQSFFKDIIKHRYVKERVKRVRIE
jgi:hypothetical protein